MSKKRKPQPGDAIRMKDGICGDYGDKTIDLSGVMGHLTEVWVAEDGSWSGEAYLNRKGVWLILDTEAELVPTGKKKVALT